MLEARIDHLVLTAPTLAEGCAYLRALLGVELEPGGRHPAMGTHNALLRLGADAYLEVIAADPEAPAPDRPRWFGLDHPDARPRLASWVVRTGDLGAAPRDFGTRTAMTRGDLRWAITVPDDGSLPWDGVAPHLIHWFTEPHPAARLSDQGCSLGGREGRHPDPERVRDALVAIGLREGFHLCPGEPPRLLARLRTPRGLRTLDSLGERDG